MPKQTRTAVSLPEPIRVVHPAFPTILEVGAGQEAAAAFASPPVTLPSEAIGGFRAIRGGLMTVVPPALARLNSVATRRLSRIAMQQALGTPRPERVIVGLDSSQRYLFLMPTTAYDPLGVDVRYVRNRPYINLFKAFETAGRKVEEGTREQFDLDITPVPVRMGNLFGRALYTPLSPLEVVVFRHLTAQQKEERARRRHRT